MKGRENSVVIGLEILITVRWTVQLVFSGRLTLSKEGGDKWTALNTSQCQVRRKKWHFQDSQHRIPEKIRKFRTIFYNIFNTLFLDQQTMWDRNQIWLLTHSTDRLIQANARNHDYYRIDTFLRRTREKDKKNTSSVTPAFWFFVSGKKWK